MANPAPKINDSNTQLIPWLQLARSENVGPVTFYELLKRYGSPEAALEVLPDLARQGGLKRPLKIAALDKIQKEIESTRNVGAEFITFNDSRYPVLLQHIDAPPPGS